MKEKIKTIFMKKVALFAHIEQYQFNSGIPIYIYTIYLGILHRNSNNAYQQNIKQVFFFRLLLFSVFKLKLMRKRYIYYVHIIFKTRK